MADAAMEQAPLPQRNGNANAVKSEPGQADQNVSQNSNNNNQNKNNNRRGGGAGNFRGGRGGGNNRNFGNRNNPNQQNRPNFPNKPGQVGFNNQKKNEVNSRWLTFRYISFRILLLIPNHATLAFVVTRLKVGSHSV